MKKAALFIFGFLLASCKQNANQLQDSAKTNGVNVVRRGNADAIPPLNGCFAVKLVKVRDYPKSANFPLSSFFDEKCNFIAKDADSAGEALKFWQKAKTEKRLSGCFLVFEAPGAATIFAYSLLTSLYQKAGTEPTGAWQETLKEGTTVSIFSEHLRENITFQPTASNFVAKLNLVSSGLNSGTIFLSSEAAPSGESNSKIVLKYSNNSSSIFKYDGHVIQSISCN